MQAAENKENQISIMVSALGNFDLLVIAAAGDPINQSMFTGYASRPPSPKGMLERFWLPEPPERIALYIFDQVIDCGENLGVDPPPMKIVLPSVVCPNQFHAAKLKRTQARSIPVLFRLHDPTPSLIAADVLHWRDS
jgi:hypothetical protein